MKLKMDGDKAVLKDGMPVYVYPDGSEVAFDAAKTIEGLNNKITAESEKAARFHKDRTEMETKLKTWDGLDRTEVDKALKLKKSLTDKEILDTNGVDELKRQMRVGFDEEKAAITKSYDEKFQGVQKQTGELHDIIYELAVHNQFANSDFFAGERRKTIYPPKDAAKIFGDRFKVEINGTKYRVVALDEAGKPLMSKQNHGELADFTEAIGIMVANRNKEFNIMAGGTPGGPGSRHNLSDDGVDPNKLSSQELIRRGLDKRMQGAGR